MAGEGVGDEPAAAKTNEVPEIDLRQVSMEYNQRRANYKRQVSRLRQAYMQQHLKDQAQDLAAQEEERAQQLRRRLERQRAKNERSAMNAQRQEELRRQAHLAFQDHLKRQQEIRDAKKELKRRARQLLLEELEEEAPLWMTSREEVDAAFSAEAEQLLWGRPQGVIGVARPSLDAHFWQYQGHTWDMSKTYQTQSDLLLQDFQDQAYWDTNLDPAVWTKERLEQQEELERKARLRALVRQEGRKALLKRQKEFLDADHETKEGEPPKPMPVPSLGVLANVRAQEKEGADLLLKDPTKFFVFDNDNSQNDTVHSMDGTTADEDGDSTYQGPTLGTPIELKDPLRDPNGGRVFPIGIGKLPKADTRSEKEKKRQEREERLWAAAQQAKSSEDLELIPEEDREFGEAIDYDANDDWDSDDEEWEKGLDQDLDSQVLNVPREFRYREQDIDFVIQQLEQKAAVMQSHVRNTVQTMEQEARSRLERAEESIAAALRDQTVSTADMAEDFASTTTTQESFFDADTTQKLRGVGADVEKYEKLMASFSQEQLLSLFGLEAKRREAKDVSMDDVASTATPSSIFEEIPGITDEQVMGLTELEAFMKVLEKAAADDVSTTIQ
jgi:hypothetical protein